MPSARHSPAQYTRPPTNTPFGRKLGFYLLGLAIGLMMVGMIVSARQQFLKPPAGAPTPQPGGPTAPAQPPAAR